MIFLFSSPRSGSTWLAKIFDSHPDTLYLHEPDIVDRGNDLLPHWFSDEPRGFEDPAKLYLTRLSQNRSLRAVGTRPVFRKQYRSELGGNVRAALIYTAKALEKAGYNSLSPQAAIPDLSRPGRLPRTVMKSVSALGRVEIFLKAQPAISAILLLRNPCAYVHSYLRGTRMGLMPPPRPLGQLLKTRSARRLDADAAACDRDLVETLAWEWLLANCEAHAAISRMGGQVVRHEDLAGNPAPELHALFSRLGLDWPASTAQFLQASTAGDGTYYSVARNPAVAANRWRQEMEPAQIEKIRNIVSRDPLGRQYFS